MRKIIGLVIIIVALVLLSYFGTGLITERTLKKDIKMINQSGEMRVDIEKYQRGWFTSDAQFALHLHVPERIVKNENDQSTIIPAQDYTFEIPLTIYHGPIIFSGSGVQFGYGYAYTNLELPKNYIEQFNQMFTVQSTKPHLNASILVNFLNKSHLRFDLPTFKLIAKEGNSEFHWQGMVSNVTFPSDMHHFVGDVTVDGLSIVKEDTKTTLGEINSNYDISQSKEGIYVGDGHIAFTSLVATENQQKVLELENVDLSSGSDIQAGLFSSHFKATLEKAMMNQKTYGPGILEMSIENLDAKVLADINEQLNRLQQSPPEARQQAWITIIPELPKLLSKGPKFEISQVSFVVPEGKIEGHLHLAIPEGKSSNPFQLIQAAKGEGQLKIPAPILQEIMRQSAKQQLAQKAQQQPQLPADSTANEPQATSTDASQVAPAPVEDTTTPSQTSVENNAPVQQGAAQQPVNEAQKTTIIEPAANLDEQARVQANQKIAALVQLGLLVKKGNDYIIELQFSNGQLSVNGQPFNPAVVKF